MYPLTSTLSRSQQEANPFPVKFRASGTRLFFRPVRIDELFLRSTSAFRRASVQRWWSYNSTYPSQTFTYDIAGNVLTSADPNGNTTHFSYNADGQNKYAFPTTIQNALSQSRSAQYDYNIGKPVAVSDLNGKQTTYAYNDLLDRATGMQLPNGGNTYYSYPNPTTVITQQDQGKSGDAALKSQVLYDGLGRANT